MKAKESDKESDKGYYWRLRDATFRKSKQDGSGLTKEETKEAMKAIVFEFDHLDNWSVANMTKTDLQKLKEAGKLFAHRIGLDPDKDDRIKLNFNR